jgi:hypothetical protein
MEFARNDVGSPDDAVVAQTEAATEIEAGRQGRKIASRFGA